MNTEKEAGLVAHFQNDQALHSYSLVEAGRDGIHSRGMKAEGGSVEDPEEYLEGGR